MTLEEEIVVYQFAQGVHPEANLLDRFDELDEDRKETHLFELSLLLWQLEPFDADSEQLIVSASSTVKASPEASLVRTYGRTHKNTRLLLDVSASGVHKSHKLLLDLFKKIYQRRFQSEKENPTRWWYQDLSNTEVVQDILNHHQELVEITYINAGYRSEFSTLAKLWHEAQTARRPKVEDLPEEKPNNYKFITYDEMITAYAINWVSKQSRGIYLLSDSLGKAIAKRYALDLESANRVVWDVVDRHLRETYNTTLRYRN